FSRRREFRSGFFADLRADVRVPVLVWEEEVQSQPIVRLSAHVSYSYFHFTLADHVFEIACTHNFHSLIRGISHSPILLLKNHDFLFLSLRYSFSNLFTDIGCPCNTGVFSSFLNSAQIQVVSSPPSYPTGLRVS